MYWSNNIRISIHERLILSTSLTSSDITLPSSEIFDGLYSRIGIANTLARFPVQNVIRDICHSNTQDTFTFKDKEETNSSTITTPCEQQLVLSLVCGMYLRESRGPLDLLRAIVDGMCGHLALLKEKGRLHRDINCYTVLLLPKPQEVSVAFSAAAYHINCDAISDMWKEHSNLPAISNRHMVHLVKTVESRKEGFGVIVGGEDAVDWPPTKGENLRKLLAGTTQSMSMHILEQMKTKVLDCGISQQGILWCKDTEGDIHTSLDDLSRSFGC
ncbi:hypothetical protein BDQ12DRAFT_164603 [Crucibulum laeve]|uniref:Fungal-type protein kinase domain-containing protein n=1 Tax=Crucibulum laeve TaxID=68775 RepID=A0A5C3MF90_9AGAR|nr:hypothetical protein BDQ12DRAFT_164603 [Crucibulum laeve]